MSIREFLPLVLAALLALAIPVQTVESQDAAKAPDLSGVWTLNEELSDAPRGRMGRGSRGGESREGARGRRGGMRGQRGGGANDGSGGEGGPAGMPTRLEIQQTAERLTILSGERERVIEIGGAPREMDGPRGSMTVSSRVEEGRLVVERVGQRGTMVETWALLDGGARLEVTVEMSGQMGGRQLKRVYDAGE